MPRKSRLKGHNFERLVVKLLKASFPDARRGNQAHNPREADIEGVPFRAECKAWASMTYKNMVDAVRQAESNGEQYGDDRIPISITKLDRHPPIVSMTLHRFIQMVEKHFWREPDNVVPIKGLEDKE